jgi:hypothetical protein
VVRYEEGLAVAAVPLGCASRAIQCPTNSLTVPERMSLGFGDSFQRRPETGRPCATARSSSNMANGYEVGSGRLRVRMC